MKKLLPAVFITLISVALFLSLVIVFVACMITICKHRRRQKSDDNDLERVRPRGTDDSKAAQLENKRAAVRRYDWTEIESLTKNFTSKVIGEGGFSTVYLARLPGSSLAAIKVHRSSGERLHRAFRQELDVLLCARHPHLVQLRGYCDDHEEGVMVFEFVPNGSLHDKLHGGGGATAAVLTWAQRMAIAHKLALAVDYLHEGCELHIVHGDIKSSNVLLDDHLAPKLCDFGFARVGFSAAVQPRPLAGPMMGSPGYADPHYLRTGIVSKKTDVYGFGVLLLELITGAEAFSAEEGVQMLSRRMGPMLKGRPVDDVVDPRLGGEYSTGEAVEMAAVAASCIGEQPSLRPSMADVLRIMREKVSSSISAVDSESCGKDET